MIITSLSVRKLVSGPGYNNHAIEATAAVMEGDDPLNILAELTDWVDAQLRGEMEIVNLRQRVDLMRQQTLVVEETLKTQRTQIAKNYEIIREHEQLRALADKAGIRTELADDSIPF